MDIDKLYQDKLFMYTIVEARVNRFTIVDQVKDLIYSLTGYHRDNMDIQDLIQVLLKVYGYLNKLEELNQINQWSAIWIRKIYAEDYRNFLDKYNIPYVTESVLDYQKAQVDMKFFNLSSTLPEVNRRYIVFKLLIN